MKKRMVSILLMLSMTAALAAGCGDNGEGKSDSGDGGKTLDVWLAPQLGAAAGRLGKGK